MEDVSQNPETIKRKVSDSGRTKRRDEWKSAQKG